MDFLQSHCDLQLALLLLLFLLLSKDGTFAFVIARFKPLWFFFGRVGMFNSTVVVDSMQVEIPFLCVSLTHWVSDILEIVGP